MPRGVVGVAGVGGRLAVRPHGPPVRALLREADDKTMCGTPAIPVRFSRFRGTVQQGPAQWQQTQIVQSWLTLDDFLP